MNYYDRQPDGQMPPPQMYYPPENFVHPEEKRRIRHSYNVIGLTLLILYIAIIVTCTVAYSIYYSDPSHEITYNDDGYPVYGFVHMIIGSCFPALITMIIFAGYCLFARYDPRELFRTEGLKAGEILRFAMIILFLQQMCAFCNIFIDIVLTGFGLEVPDLNYDIEHTPQVYLAELFALIVLAPIGEELIFRGVVLRCSAKISQRFGIFFSAFIFGIMHGNPYQFVLGFLNGIILALITIRTGSLIPAIICHATNNAMGSIPMVIGYFDEDAALVVNLLMLVIFFISGIIVFVHSFMTGKLELPKYDASHKARTMPILITSWSTIVVMIFYIIDLIGSVQRIETPPQELLTEAARIVLK